MYALTGSSVLRLPFLQALHALLSECAVRDPLLASRVARAILPSLTMLLGTQSDAQEDNVSVIAGKSKKGKKRARGYEGDEVFKITKEVILPSHESGEVIIFSLGSTSSHITGSAVLTSLTELSRPIPSVAGIHVAVCAVSDKPSTLGCVYDYPQHTAEHLLFGPCSDE